MLELPIGSLVARGSSTHSLVNCGSASCKNWIRLSHCPNPTFTEMPVIFPASSARLGTMPASIGAAKTPTIGIVVVVALKSRVRFVLKAMIGSGLRTTTSRPKSG